MTFCVSRANTCDQPVLRRIREAVGDRLRLRRLALGLTMADVAERLVQSVAQIQRYETAETNFTITRLTELARALDIPLSDLIFHTGEQDTKQGETAYLLSKPKNVEALALFDSMPPGTQKGVLGMLRAVAKENGYLPKD